MDFLLDEGLDLALNDNVIDVQQDGETTLIAAFFTDARVNNQRGYWFEVQASEIWRYEQARLTNEVASELNETAKEIAKSLVEQGLYTKIATDAYVSSGVMTLQVTCYDKKQIVVNRKFAI